MALNVGYLTSNSTVLGDEVYTPFYAVDPLLEFLQDKKDKVIWCPFDEEWSAFYQTFIGGGVQGYPKFFERRKGFFQISA